ncbi:AAA-ATPase [Dichanthelium oligosanthes]|uniref:AAA-ATPase n=1 Tax=Dichanthelium oligosanthes TaxID=888268 RepID=A0A1E5UJ60_9POAL|nr:AAA-ATPase [Dichanthelium oligosanthes]
MTDGKGPYQQTASLELTFDAAHTDMVLGRYVPFITAKVEEARRRERTLQIFSSENGGSWRGTSYHHPATFDTLAMEPELKWSIVADLDRFLKRKDYRRIGKAWKRGYLLYGPPGTGKSSLVTAMAKYLRFNLYDLDLSKVRSISTLQWLLTSTPDKSILVIEDIDKPILVIENTETEVQLHAMVSPSHPSLGRFPSFVMMPWGRSGAWCATAGTCPPVLNNHAGGQCSRVPVFGITLAGAKLSFRQVSGLAAQLQAQHCNRLAAWHCLTACKVAKAAA